MSTFNARAFLIAMLCLCFSRAALSASRSTTTTPRPVHAFVAVGTEGRPQRDTDGRMLFQNLQNDAIGFGYKQYVFVLERSNLEESSGNATLNVERKYQDILAWAEWRAFTWKYMSPFVGAGVGAFQEQVTTRLAGADSVTRTSPYKLLGGGNVGLSLDVPYLWLSLEARMLFGDELDPQPSIGGLVRLGVWF